MVENWLKATESGFLLCKNSKLPQYKVVIISYENATQNLEKAASLMEGKRKRN